MRYKNSLFKIAVLLLLMLGFLNPVNTADLFVSLFIFVYTGTVLFLGPLLKKIPLTWFLFLLSPLLVAFLISSINNSSTVRKYVSVEPLSGSYRTDMDDFLKTYYLMGRGETYYMAYKSAVEGNPFKGVAPSNLWSWRLPTIFYIWHIVSFGKGITIWFLFLGLSLFTLTAISLCTYELLPNQHKYLGVLAFYLAFPYLHFAVRDTTLLQTEWWGMFFTVFGLYFLFKGRNLTSAIFFAVAVLIRELFILPLLIIMVIRFIKRQEIKFFFIPCIALFILLIGHLFEVRHLIGLGQTFLTLRTHAIGKEILLPTLAFGSWEYFFSKLRIFIFLYLVGLASIYFNKSERGLYLTSFFLFPLVFLFIGTSMYNDYWGIFYIPFIFISIPLILIRLL